MRRVIISFTLAFALLLLLDVYPGLRGGAGWRWPYALPQSLMPVVILALVLIIYLGGAHLLGRFRRDWPLLIWAVIGGAVISVAVVGLRGEAAELLFLRTISPVQTGAVDVAVRYFAQEGVTTTLQDWPSLMQNAESLNLIHFTTSPPGQPLLHHAVAGLFDALPSVSRPLSMALRPFGCDNLTAMGYTRGEIVSVGIIGLAMPLWAALLALPVYAAGRGLTGNRRVARHLAAWSALIPTVALFAPTWNTLYPFLGALSFALLLHALNRAHGLYALLGGMVFSAETFLNFAVLPLLLLFGLFTLGYWFALKWGDGRTFAWPVRIGAWFGLGLLTCWLPFTLASGYTPLDLWRVTVEAHGQLVQRDYLPWVFLAAYDTLLFMGWPLAGLFALGVWRAWLARRTPSPVDLLAAAALMTFIAVDLSGIAQGENGRIMSFYAPFFLLAGAGWLTARPAGWNRPLLWAQGVMFFVMALALPVVPLDVNRPPDEPRQDVPTLEDIEPMPADVTFSSTDYLGNVRLESYRHVADVAAQTITLETRWRGVERTERPYRFEVVARAENESDGEIVTAAERWPAQNGNYPPTCWRPGDVVRDVHIIDLPVVSAPVAWTLSLRLVDPRTGAAMTPTATLGPIPYP